MNADIQFFSALLHVHHFSCVHVLHLTLWKVSVCRSLCCSFKLHLRCVVLLCDNASYIYVHLACAHSGTMMHLQRLWQNKVFVCLWQKKWRWADATIIWGWSIQWLPKSVVKGTGGRQEILKFNLGQQRGWIFYIRCHWAASPSLDTIIHAHTLLSAIESSLFLCFCYDTQ